MKKILALLLACSMLFAFAACGGNTDTETTTAAPEETTVAEETTAAEETTVAGEETTAAEETTIAGEETTAAEGTTVAGAAAEMTKADFVAFFNAETAKAAKGSYKYNRNCKFVNPIDVGNMTDALNKVIKMIDKNSDLNSVVGGFLGIGTKTGSFPKDEPDDDYQLKAAKLTEADLQNFSYADGVYSFTLANASNPKKTNATPISRFTNDFITHEEVDEGIKDAAGSLVTLNSTDVDYTNIKVTVTVAEGKITAITYKYDFAASLELKILVGKVNGSGSAKTTGEFTAIQY
mgnify:CR=1 FL=1